MGNAWDKLMEALAKLFGAVIRGANVIDKVAQMAENAAIAGEKHSRALIPTDEQIEVILAQALENRDTSIDTKALAIAEAKARLEAAKAKRNADNK